jgi:RimJ/RimL family protein N-acetyltransferase
VAWVIASPHQGHGYARDAAQAMVSWLRHRGANTIVAHIQPDHHASAAVARAAGLEPTPVFVDREIRWQSSHHGRPR